MEKVIQEAFEEAVKQGFSVLLDNLVAAGSNPESIQESARKFVAAFRLAKSGRDLAIQTLKGEEA